MGIELVCKDKDAWGPLFNKTSRPRDDDETVDSLWSDWDVPRRMMQVALWIKERNEETGEWESTYWKMLEESRCDDWSFQGHTIRETAGVCCGAICCGCSWAV